MAIEPYGFCYTCQKCEEEKIKSGVLKDTQEKVIATVGSLLNCGSCHVAQYCNRDCQAKAWPTHKTECRKAQVSLSRAALNKAVRKIFFEVLLATPDNDVEAFVRSNYLQIVIDEHSIDQNGGYRVFEIKKMKKPKTELSQAHADKLLVEVYQKNSKSLGTYLYMLSKRELPEPRGVHFYTFGPKYSSLMKQWQTKDETGISPQNVMSFQEYLKKEVDKDPKTIEELLKNTTHYFNEEELKTLEVSVKDGKLRVNYPYLSEWVKLRESGYKEPYQTYLKNRSKLGFEHKGIFEDKSLLKAGEDYIFVITHHEKFYVLKKIRGESTHSSLSNGEPVLSCGELRVDEQGKIIKVTNWSGHYHTCEEGADFGEAGLMVNTLQFFQEKGIDITKIQQITLEWCEGYDRLPPVHLAGPSCHPISKWIEDRQKVSRLQTMYLNLMKWKDPEAAFVAAKLQALTVNYPYDEVMKRNVQFTIRP